MNCVYSNCALATTQGGAEGSNKPVIEKPKDTPTTPSPSPKPVDTDCGDDEVFVLHTRNYAKYLPNNTSNKPVVVVADSYKLPNWKLTLRYTLKNPKTCDFPDANAKWIWHSAEGDTSQCVVFERSFVLDYEQPSGSHLGVGWIHVACEHIYTVVLQEIEGDKHVWGFHTGTSKPGTCDINYWSWSLKKASIIKVYVQKLFPNDKKTDGFLFAMENGGALLRSDNSWTWSPCEKPTPLGSVLKPIPEGSDASCHEVCADNSPPGVIGGCLKAYSEKDGVDMLCRNRKEQKVWCDCNSFVWPKSAQNVPPEGPDVIVYTNPERPGWDVHAADQRISGWVDPDNYYDKYHTMIKSANIGGFGGKYAKVVPNGTYRGEEEWVYYVQSMYIPNGKNVEIQYIVPTMIQPINTRTWSYSVNDLFRDGAHDDLNWWWPLLNTKNYLIYFKVY